jgi:hypothetical protein
MLLNAMNAKEKVELLEEFNLEVGIIICLHKHAQDVKVKVKLLVASVECVEDK